MKHLPAHTAFLNPWEADERHTADTPTSLGPPRPYCKAVSQIWNSNGARTDTSKAEKSEEPSCALNLRVALIQDTLMS